MNDLSAGEDGEFYIIARCRGNTERPYHGTEWDDGAGGRIIQICIWHGDLIYGIQSSYELNGRFYVTRRHGGNEGDFEQILLDEPITCVSGYYGSWCLEPDIVESEEEAPHNYTTVIRSLKFETGRATYGPFGQEKGLPFSFKMVTGCGGFHGRSSSNDDNGLLQAIGVFVRSFAPISPSIPSAPSVVDPNKNDEQ
ncbi:Mannose-binding lectins domain-containing protein [Dioscorea alata]|uniref:Mannose-binding lectins domain-containing protein n=2 Tax=Dioscorea alata TaxID=55571 RepID=A0ACB7VIV7_DIOAL|nr:Mannose-binding lectins domain-containing protein [Dioscorea alata]KAH7674026.1 Mannose-binding lectins domain-containing protein [Dioscorea alata]